LVFKVRPGYHQDFVVVVATVHMTAEWEKPGLLEDEDALD
jgi:hypothetical protein